MPIACDVFPVDERQILRGEDQKRPRVHRDARIDADDLRVGHGTSNENTVDHAIQVNVVGKVRAPGKQPKIFLSDRRIHIATRVHGTNTC